MAKAYALVTGSVDREGENTMALYVTVHSVEGERYTQVIESGQHVLVADQPKKAGGADKGPGPHSYLLAALGT
jgi:uncharacterized OsmC-like protein